jgi:hypothetical protein
MDPDGWFHPIWSSTLFGIVVGTFIAAYIGVKGAQNIVERNRIKESKLREIRQTNAVITLASSIAEVGLNLKGQHVLALKEKFDAQRKAVIAHVEKLDRGESPPPIHLDFDMQTLDSVEIPADLLVRHLFEHVSVVGRPISLASVLMRVARSLNNMLTRRNEILNTFKQRTDDPGTFAIIYFGIPRDGKTQMEYADTVNAIAVHVDDIIWFAERLVRDLVEHGEKLRKEYGRAAPSILKLTIPEKNQRLLPADSGYQDWLDGFVTTKKANPWDSIIAVLIRLRSLVWKSKTSPTSP